MMLNILYEQAMAGFAHSPSWKRVHAMLLIGPFFTHVAWSSRPPDNSLVPIKHVRVPQGKKSKDKKTETDTQDYGDAIQVLLDNIERYKSRTLPDQVYFFNERVIKYNVEANDCDHGYHRVTITPQYLWSLAHPISKHFPDFVDTSTMFAPPSRKPPMKPGQTVCGVGNCNYLTVIDSHLLQSTSKRTLREVLINGPIAAANSSLAMLGYNATPSPPTSHGDRSGPYKATGSTRDARQQPPLRTRASQAALHLNALPMIGD